MGPLLDIFNTPIQEGNISYKDQSEKLVHLTHEELFTDLVNLIARATKGL